MMKERKFHITSKTMRDNACKFVNQICQEQDAEVVIRKFKKDKTPSQRGAFHALCKKFGDELGWTLAEVKEHVKKSLYGTYSKTLGDVTTEHIKSSEECDRDEYNELIERLLLIASQQGVYLEVS